MPSSRLDVEQWGKAAALRLPQTLKRPHLSRKGQSTCPLTLGATSLGEKELPFLTFHTQSTKFIFYDYFSLLKTFLKLIQTWFYLTSIPEIFFFLLPLTVIKNSLGKKFQFSLLYKYEANICLSWILMNVSLNTWLILK